MYNYYIFDKNQEIVRFLFCIYTKYMFYLSQFLNIFIYLIYYISYTISRFKYNTNFICISFAPGERFTQLHILSYIQYTQFCI